MKYSVLFIRRKKGEILKAEKYIKMTEEVDPEIFELPKWIE